MTTDDVIDVDVCAGQATGTDRTDVVNDVNLCHTVDETATWLRGVEDKKNGSSYTQYNPTLHYPLPRLDFLKF